MTDDERSEAVASAFGVVPGLVDLVRTVGLAPAGDAAMTVAACELVLEALVARKRISRSDGGLYGRVEAEKRRRRPNEDFFGGGMSA